MVTADTNVAFYALTDGEKGSRAEEILASADFVSVQLLNEYAFACRRKLKRPWREIARDVELLRTWVGEIKPIDVTSSHDALRLAERYQLSFFDALMLAVALANGATVFYSEDMQHDLMIDGVLRVVDPFRVDAE